MNLVLLSPFSSPVMADKENHHTYVEDADEEGNPIDDTKTFVSTAAPPSVKEAANVSRMLNRNKDRLRRRDSSSSPTTKHHADSDSTANPGSPLKRERESRRSKESKDKTRKEEKRKSVPSDRPPARSSKTLPNIQTTMSSRRPQDQSLYFGISPSAPSPVITAASTSSRPRAYTANQRPTSYYGPSASRPPQASARYWQPPPGYPTLGTSFPPQAPLAPPTASPYQAPYPPPQAFAPLQPQPDYFNQDPRIMQHRPEYRRPSSAMGRRFPSPYSPEYDDLEDGGVPVRTPSLRRRSTRQEEDRTLMPPPPPRRPSTSIPTHPSPFGLPPKRQSIGSITSLGYDDESIDDDSIYSASDQPRYDYRAHAVQRPRIEPTAMYDVESRYEPTTPGRRNRRDSLHHPAATATARNHSTERDVEDKMHSAQRYQARVEGPIDPLTFDSIRRMNKTPSAGTKSTRSRGESGGGGGGGGGYALTSRATSVPPDNEDMTILVRGTATLTIGNAQMDVREGAEIRIPTGAGGGGGGPGDRNSRQGGSDHSSSSYETERPPPVAAAYEGREREFRSPRYERERDRERGVRGSGRATSRAGSHSRGGGLGYAPPPTEYSGGGGGYPQQHYHPVPVYGYAPPNSHPYTYPTHLNQF